MAEEQNWQEPGSHTLCANNCGFFGSPTTLNLCSKCYKDLSVEEHQMSKAKLALENSFTQSKSESDSSSLSSSSMSFVSVPSAAPAEMVAQPVVARPNRCASCRKRVGLTGFTCKCGIMFCGSHRYPEQHGCTFDFKALGKEAITGANPVVKAEKLQKL